ncbi:methyltransferase domain-containing protein [Pseudomonas baetica]|uniref:class I SAM-dependent methyltransferase n=1 Tax=Pseudomonas baetica TaxID=674054 RepID=UPI001C8BFD8F|nr:methyltransferase domain-containing protein [Pseudomonas baetica]MBX9409680.1 methyltransferase domain-containing protein [Pseudomonas baetica]
MERYVMLIPNNPDLDFQELNRRIEAEVQRYKLENSGRSLPTFDPFPAEPADRTYAWMELVQLNDKALIKAAYPALLGRKAQSTEIQQGLQELHAGGDKFELLARLRFSPEGKVHNAEVHGLRRAWVKAVIRRIPVLGNIILSVYGMALTESRHRHYTARLDMLVRQNQLQNNRTLAQKNLLSTQQHKLQDAYQYLQDHQTALQEQHEAQNRQAAEFSRLEAELQQAKNVQQELRVRLNLLEKRPQAANADANANIVATASQPAPQAQAQAQAQAQSSIPDSFYLAFENRFRGDAETIRSRQSYYLPMLDKVAPLIKGLPLVDIGCGRGEWLQMLPERFQCVGIDLNSMNVEACHTQGLNAVQQDALVWLANQPKNSIAVITAFHVIEHLSFEQFNILLDECQRVLAPGGVVIFETPNPENLISAATHFHTDPTHIHPLPPAFTEFLVEFKGFEQVQIHRINPIPREYALNEDSEVSRRCDALFYGPQDYAVTASKSLS